MAEVNRMVAGAQSFGRAGQRPAQTTTPPPVDALAPPHGWVFSAFLMSFDAIGRNFVTVVALIAAAAAPERIVTHLVHFDWHYLALSYLIMFVMACGLWGAIIRLTLDAARGVAVNFNDCIISGLIHLPSALVLVARPSLGIAVAMLLLVMPPLIHASHWPILLSQEEAHTFVRIGWFATPGAILLALRWFVAPAAMVAENLGIRDSIARSRALTARHVPGFFLAAVALIALALMLGSIMEPLWGMPAKALPVFLIGNWLAPLIITALTASVATSLYLNLAAAENEAVDPT